MTRRSATIALSAAVLLAACGGSNPGTGTGTLFASARFSSDGSTPSSRARVQVRQAAMTGAIVTDAQVFVGGGKMPRTPIPFVAASEEYRLDGFGWDDALRLEIVRGRDQLDATVQTPGFSIITAPTQDASVRRADGQLRVTWRDSLKLPAMIARVRLDHAPIDTTLADDTFEFAVQAEQLVITDRETVLLERSNEVAPAGGTPGSAITATTTHAIQFRVE